MVCKKCYYNNDENSKFCIKCGEKLEPEVSQTSTQNVNSNFQNATYSAENNEVVNYSPASAIAALVLSFLCCSCIPGIVFSILALVEGGKIKPATIQGNIRRC